MAELRPIKQTAGGEPAWGSMTSYGGRDDTVTSPSRYVLLLEGRAMTSSTGRIWSQVGVSDFQWAW